MTWKAEIDEIDRRRRLALELGGAEKVARHRAAGKLTVRERVAGLVDEGSFDEIGSISGFPEYDADGRLASFTPANVICGRATIDARPVFVTGDDFTVRGGANDGGVREKFAYAETNARRWRVPLVRLVDGTGGGGSVKHLETIGRTYLPDVEVFTEVLDAMSEVPVVSLALGSVAGMGAARVCASHYSMIVAGTAQLFAAGPPVVARAGETVTKEALGGSAVHTRNGTIDDEVASEAEAFTRARRFLSYLPSSVHSLAARDPCDDPPGRRSEALLDAIPRDPRKVYRMRPILEHVFDHGSWFEIGRGWGRSVIAGLARLDGWPVAVLASDCYHYGGAWTADACRKAVRLSDLAQTFHLPVVHFVDIPGFLIGTAAEAFARARRFLSYLPSSVHSLAARAACDDPPGRRAEALLDAIPRDPRKVYRMRPILEHVFDHGSWFEIGRGWGRSVIAGLARLDGWPVAVLASDPYHYGGAWTADASRKAVRLSDLAQTFHLPVVHFVDIPGFLIGTAAEASGVMRHGTQALAAIRQSTVPWHAVVVRKAFGMAGLAQRNGARSFMRVAWPSAQWGSLPIAGGVEAAYRAVIEAAPDPAAKRAEIEAKLEALQSPLRTAEAFGVEEIIDPRDTRRRLCEFARLAQPMLETGRSGFGYRP